MLVTVYVCMSELGTSSQAPKSGTAKSNSDRGKSVNQVSPLIAVKMQENNHVSK